MWKRELELFKIINHIVYLECAAGGPKFGFKSTATH